jgi:hypothetical protein
MAAPVLVKIKRKDSRLNLQLAVPETQSYVALACNVTVPTQHYGKGNLQQRKRTRHGMMAPAQP